MFDYLMKKVSIAFREKSMRKKMLRRSNPPNRGRAAKRVCKAKQSIARRMNMHGGFVAPRELNTVHMAEHD